MHPTTSSSFKSNARKALADEGLQKALGHIKHGFQVKRAKAIAKLPEFAELTRIGEAIKNHTLENLDFYLESFEKKVIASGGQVHWARTAADAREAVLAICREAGARKIIKSKSMITEEIDLNHYLEHDGFEVVETDLGEYIVQLRGERPSHLIAPAIHVLKEQVAESFKDAHHHLPDDRPLNERRELLEEARAVLRGHFLSADVGITGANFLVAETGTSVMVTNEGNGDLTQTLPRIHIVVTSIEKMTPNLNDVSTLLRLLARSATGQEISSYTTFTTGPKREGDVDGPDQYHVVLLDNGRSEMLGSSFKDALRCIRCSACLNHCPVYGAIGGHAYGWVYQGPIGSVLTPQLIGVNEAGHLPNASSFCGKCEEVCPMHIPLPKMMRHWREQEFEKHLGPASVRFGIKIWAFFAKRPWLYRFASGLAARVLSLIGGRKKRLRSFPLAGGWTCVRDLPAPEGKTFHQLLKKKRGRS